MFGWTEVLFVASLVVLFFGWRKFPDAARGLAESIKLFKRELNGKTRDVKEYKGPENKDT